MAGRALFSARLAVVVSAIVGTCLLLAAAAQASTITLLDQTIPGPLGGTTVCVDSVCKSANGIKNLHVVATLNTSSLAVPVVLLGPAAGCTQAVSVQATVTSIGGSGTIGGSISFQPVDQNGNDVGPPVTLPLGPVPVSGSSPPQTITICGSLF